jgi:hypothetical protein
LWLFQRSVDKLYANALGSFACQGRHDIVGQDFKHDPTATAGIFDRL